MVEDDVFGTLHSFKGDGYNNSNRSSEIPEAIKEPCGKSHGFLAAGGNLNEEISQSARTMKT